MFIETGLEEALEDMYSYSMQKIVDDKLEYTVERKIEYYAGNVHLGRKQITEVYERDKNNTEILVSASCIKEDYGSIVFSDDKDEEEIKNLELPDMGKEILLIYNLIERVTSNGIEVGLDTTVKIVYAWQRVRKFNEWYILIV